jgi:hypothetical protein
MLDNAIADICLGTSSWWYHLRLGEIDAGQGIEIKFKLKKTSPFLNIRVERSNPAIEIIHLEVE